jgi:hypothetical protein
MRHVNSHQLSMLVVSVLAVFFFSFVESICVNDSCMSRLANGSCFLLTQRWPSALASFNRIFLTGTVHY